MPVHASGPYRMPHYRLVVRAIHTQIVPSGAFRGFGVPQARSRRSSFFDELAGRFSLDPLEFRLNALGVGEPTVTGQVFADGIGFKACLDALRPDWRKARAETERFNPPRRNACQARRRRRRHVVRLRQHLASNPSTMRLA